MLIKKRKLILVTEDDDGYEECMCALCKSYGCVDQIKHKKSCPMPQKGDYLIIKTARK